MEEQTGYPRYQWSIFVKNGKDQQFVVRANDITEFKQLLSDVKALIGEEIVNPTQVAPVVAPQAVVLAPAAHAAGLACNTCGQPATQKSGTNKNGKPYNAIFCSSENRTHNVWL